MISGHQQKLLRLWNHLNPQLIPSSQDETLAQIARLLAHALGEVRVLFYLKSLPSYTNPLEVIPCPARPLAPGVFVCDGSTRKGCFTFETEQFCYLPLTLGVHNFGCLFLESRKLPFDDATQLVIATLAIQLAHGLHELGYPGVPYAGRADPSIPLKLDPLHRRVWVAGEALYVRNKEFIFLNLLNQWRDQGEPCPQELLYKMVYPKEVAPTGERETRLDSLVARLRRKLERVAGRQVRIETIRGVGYRLRLDPPSS